MTQPSVDITLNHTNGTVELSPSDVFSELDERERTTANADTVVGMLKGHKSKIRALREWELLSDDDFTINVSVKAADGTVSTATW